MSFSEDIVTHSPVRGQKETGQKEDEEEKEEENLEEEKTNSSIKGIFPKIYAIIKYINNCYFYRRKRGFGIEA